MIEEIDSDFNSTASEEEEIILEGVTEQDIIEAIKACLKLSPYINASQTLVTSVFNIMKSLLISDKRFIIIEAPTGSGKTLIGFISHFVIQYLYLKKNDPNFEQGESRPDYPANKLSYFLTSAKMLQEQIDGDLERFDFRNYIFMLKGRDNYDCFHETEKLKEPYKLDDKGKKITRISYVDRPCKGMDNKDRDENYPDCNRICPYQVARFEASDKSCTILNYAYFLNIMRVGFNPFFGTRYLTIADEAHLIPDIVCNIFNYEFTQFRANQLYKLHQELALNFGNDVILDNFHEAVMKLFKIFKNPLSDLSLITEYFLSLQQCKESLIFISKDPRYLSYKNQINKNKEGVDELVENKDEFDLLISTRPEDVYFESEQVAHDKVNDTKVWKHIVKDLSESNMVRKNFISKVNKAIFMSATLGDMDEYAQLMGIKESEYDAFRLPSLFDFGKSPIYLCKSAWLNYNNFQSNIDKVIMDCIKICNTLHPKEKGIIHTSTFAICNLLKEKINMGLVPDKTRFLFYQTADEKEKCVELMKQSLKPYIIVGPSLYEGLSLDNDCGRFNILIKTPYSAMSPYIKKKIERFPFWYERNTIEKIVQGIGRTNRNTNDYSKVYLLDCCFDKLIYKTNESIVSRLQTFKIY